MHGTYGIRSHDGLFGADATWVAGYWRDGLYGPGAGSLGSFRARWRHDDIVRIVVPVIRFVVPAMAIAVIDATAAIA